MDTKITKKRIDKHLEYDWIKYILIIVAAIFLWWAIYSIVDNPNGYERIDIFVSVNTYDTDGETVLYEQIDKALEINNDEIIRKKTVMYFANEIEYSTKAQTCDLFVATEDRLFNEEGASNFVPLNLNAEVLELIGINPQDYEFYYPVDKNNVTAEDPIAIKLTGARLKAWLPSTFKTTVEEVETDVPQVYYIGIVGMNIMGAGENIGKFNTKRTEHDQTFYILKYLLEYYKG